ncbi:MAG: redoxin domain-containing protein [Acidobacteriaceae bacterium]
MKLWKPFLLAVLGVAIAGILVVALLAWRGFRATSMPSAIETVVARTVRNLAIPSSERRKKNPLQADLEALRDGREDFLMRCVICHGVDGSGKTQIGLNLYPRAPDLRAPATQNVSDGAIHYIIENGVQFTGMPAWGNPHRESNGDSWKLVLFIRNLRPLTREELSHQSAIVANAHYVGSETCEKCHADSLHQYRGKWIVLYFYPKDQTAGCTIEARNFQHDINKFEALNAIVLGVSVDSVKSHRAFCAKDGLHFKLLADTGKKAVQEYGSLGEYMGVQMAKRNTFLINPEGKIMKEWIGVDPTHHSTEVLSAIKYLKKNS